MEATVQRDMAAYRAHGRSHLLVIALTLVVTPRMSAQVSSETAIRGVVSAAGAAQVPIAGATVVLTGSKDSVRTLADGQFVLRASTAGRHVLAVRALGYAPRMLDVVVSATDGWTGTIELERLPQTLPAVDVADRRDYFEYTTKYDGFFQRKKRGLGGTFRTYEDFEKSGASNMASALAGIPGVAVSTTVSMYSGIPEYRFRIARCPGNPPNIAVYIDGQLILGVRERFSELMSSILLTDVRYVEFYRGPGQIPSDIERGDNCAVLLIWMR